MKVPKLFYFMLIISACPPRIALFDNGGIFMAVKLINGIEAVSLTSTRLNPPQLFSEIESEIKHE